MHRYASLIPLLCVNAMAIPSAEAQPVAASSIEAKIQYFENNIAPAVVIRGQGGSQVTLASRMAALHVPGASVAVIHDGKVEWARGFGVTKVNGPPVTTSTLFQAGSISKPVTAMAVLHLVQTGRLGLDSDVNQYLKTWKVPENGFTSQKAVTLRELLTHTAGVTVHGFPGYASSAPVPTLKQVLDGKLPANTPAIRVDTLPGTIWRYSGGGYEITQQLLLDVTGKSFPTLMRDTVLGPLEMTHSTYEQPLPMPRSAEAASPYDQNGAAIIGGAHTYPEMAAAGLWTTPSDLARYAIEIQKSLVGQSNLVLSKSTTEEMVKSGGMGGWGLGLEVGGGSNQSHFGHGGADEGFISNLVAYNNGDGVAIMTNGDNGGRLAEEILRTIALEYRWPDFTPVEKTVATVDPKLIEAYEGYYRQGRFAVVNFVRNNDHLAAQQGQQSLGDVYPASDRDWFYTSNTGQVSFTTGSNGNVIGYVRHTNGTDVSASRISASDAIQIANELTEKIKSQSQDPASEAILRRNIDELRDGKPDYDKMSPGLANVTRAQLSDLQNMIKSFGTIKSVTFKGVGPAGADIYQVDFEKGSTEWRIIVGPGEKIESIGLRTL